MNDLPIEPRLIYSGALQVQSNPDVVKTPLCAGLQKELCGEAEFNLFVKLECLQNSGSFKIRGIINQMIENDCFNNKKHICCIAKEKFSMPLLWVCKKYGFDCTIYDTEANLPFRIISYKNNVLDVINLPPSGLKDITEELKNDNDEVVYIRECDSPSLIAGYASIGKEIIDDCPNIDILLAPIGRGNLMAGLISAFKVFYTGRPCKIYGVELEGACSMFRSMKVGYPVCVDNHAYIDNFRSVGKLGLNFCSKYVDDILLVTKDDVNEALDRYVRNGIKVEHLGALGLAAIISGKVPNIQNKNVVTLATGKNESTGELLFLHLQDILSLDLDMLKTWKI